MPSVTINAGPQGNAFYTWTGSNGYTATGAQVILSAGATFTLRVTDVPTGCAGTTTFEVQQKTQRPAFIASVIPTQCEAGSAVNGKIIVTSFDPGSRYAIEASQTFTGSTTYSSLPLVLPNTALSELKPARNDEYYVLRIMNSSSCIADTVLMNRKSPCANELFIPDVFTPDGDGNNDAFVITGAPAGQTSLDVYNRWGSRVYHSDNYANDWTGQSGGSKLPAGTYYYVFEVKDSATSAKTGFIVIQY
jgi:gliding motility-associated-like protein